VIGIIDLVSLVATMLSCEARLDCCAEDCFAKPKVRKQNKQIKVKYSVGKRDCIG
jgi:hypothetical protein